MTRPDWLADVLAPGEQLRWAGQPDPRRYAFAKGFKQSVLGVPLIIFAMLVWDEARIDGRTIMSVLGFLMIAGGVGMVLSPLWHAWIARYVGYAVTDRRALVYRALPAPKLTSYAPEDMNQHGLRLYGDGSGSVHFAGDLPSRKLGWSPAVPVGFFGIPDAEYVAGLVRDLQVKASTE